MRGGPFSRIRGSSSNRSKGERAYRAQRKGRASRPASGLALGALRLARRLARLQAGLAKHHAGVELAPCAPHARALHKMAENERRALQQDSRRQFQYRQGCLLTKWNKGLRTKLVRRNQSIFCLEQRAPSKNALFSWSDGLQESPSTSYQICSRAAMFTQTMHRMGGASTPPPQGGARPVASTPPRACCDRRLEQHCLSQGRASYARGCR
jgi:hypothetical protein